MKAIHRTLRGLLRWPAVYFYYTARPVALNPIQRRRRRNEEAARDAIRANGALSRAIEETRAASGSTGCEWGDYWALYRTVVDRAPRTVLELGSGVSSAVIACALKDVFRDGGFTFVSLEESEAYHDEIRRAIPRDLAAAVDLRLARRWERPFGDDRGCGYEPLPDGTFDFVFIDGPTLKAQEPGARKCFNADLIDLAARADRPFRATLDQRIGTMWALKERLPRAAFSYDPVTKLTTIDVPAREARA